MEIRKISRFVTLGDSLSDRGTMNNRYLMGFIPMRWLIGLNRESPAGRFTNGLAWSDHIVSIFSNSFFINELKHPTQSTKKIVRSLDDIDIATDKNHKPNLNSEDIVDALIRHRARAKMSAESSDAVEKMITQKESWVYQSRDLYSLKDDKKASYKGENLVRNYNEGGLTSFSYSWVIDTLSWSLTNLKLFFTCLLIATLGEKRSELLADDKKHNFSKQHKAETLVIEWSGGNDLITANARPTQLAADRSVAARLENVKELMKNGYQHFVWFNLPNLALTPLYQAKSSEEQANAEKWTTHFNKELDKAYKELRTNYPQCSFELFDVNSIFNEIYRDPKANGFDPEKLTKCYTKEALNLQQDGTSPGKGYMFWDEIHPSADMHALLAERFYQKFKGKYIFSPPKNNAANEEVIDVTEAEFLAAYKNVHSKNIRKAQGSFFSARPAPIPPVLTLEIILTQALHGGDKHALATMKELNWLNAKGQVNINSPVLKAAFQKANDPRSTSQLENIDREDMGMPLLAHG